MPDVVASRLAEAARLSVMVVSLLVARNPLAVTAVVASNLLAAAAKALSSSVVARALSSSATNPLGAGSLLVVCSFAVMTGFHHIYTKSG